MAIGKTYVDDITNALVAVKAISFDDGQLIKVAFKKSDYAIFDDFLIQEGLVDKETLLKTLSVHYQVPSFDVVGYFFDSVLLRNFQKDFLLRNAIIPLEPDTDMLIVVASEPDLPDLLVSIEEFIDEDVRFVVGLQGDITDAIKEFYDPALTEEPTDSDLREERHIGLQEERMAAGEESAEVEEYSNEDSII
jgi:hypothetical protein